MDGLLANVFRYGDRAKKRVKGLLSLENWKEEWANRDAWEPNPISNEQLAEGLLGGGVIGTFGGVKAKTADLAKKAAAEVMEKAGSTRDDIWRATGWFRGPDKKWRFEISDHAADLVRDPDGYRNTVGKLSEVLKHDDLYAAYPQLKKIPTDASTYSENILGSYGRGLAEPNVSISVSSPNTAGAVSGLLHEGGGHAVQQIEGFARGGTPMDKFPLGVYRESVSDLLKPEFDRLVASGNENRAIGLANVRSMELYKRLAGEAEARAIQARMYMRPEQRMQVPPWESYDVPWDRLIVRDR